MKKAQWILLLILSILGCTTSSSWAQKPEKQIDVEGQAVNNTQGTNPHIHSDMPEVDNPEAKTRGSACIVKFSNSTGLFIRLFVDGRFKGVLGPFAKQTVNVNSGYTTIYAISSGNTKEWGADGNCAGIFTYNFK